MKHQRRPSLIETFANRARVRRLAKMLTEDGERLVTAADLRIIQI